MGVHGRGEGKGKDLWVGFYAGKGEHLSYVNDCLGKHASPSSLLQRLGDTASDITLDGLVMFVDAAVKSLIEIPGVVYTLIVVSVIKVNSYAKVLPVLKTRM